MIERPTPVLPPDHPLASYGEYMLSRMDAVAATQTVIFWLCIVGITAICILIVVFTAFCYLKWREREEVKGWRAEVVKFTEMNALLHSTIKGWTVIRIEEERKKADLVAATAADLKQSMPTATAEAVVNRIRDEVVSPSGEGLVPLLPKSGVMKKPDAPK